MYYCLILVGIMSLLVHAYTTKDKEAFNSTDKLILWIICTVLVCSALIVIFDIK